MDKTVSIALYEIKLKAHTDEKKPTKWNVVPFSYLNRQDSYAEFIRDIIDRTLSDYQHIKHTQEVCCLAEPMALNGFELDGRLRYGKHGDVADIINTENAFQEEFKLQAHHAPVMPYYFYFYLHPDADSAYMCLQRYGNKGAYNVLKTQLEREFKLILGDDYNVSINKLAPYDYIKQVNNDAARPTKIILSYPVFTKGFDKIDVESGEKEQKEVKLNARQVIDISPLGTGAKLEHFMQKFKKDKPAFYTEIGLKEDTQTRIEREYIEVKFGGKNFKMTLSEGRELASYFDVTDEVKIDQGVPVLKEIRAAVQTIMKAVLKAARKV